jgi:hypothetical protein
MIPEEYLVWRFHSKVLSWTVIEFIHHRFDLFIRNLGEFCSFGKVLPDQTVHVFIESTLPRNIRMGEEKFSV